MTRAGHLTAKPVFPPGEVDSIAGLGDHDTETLYRVRNITGVIIVKICSRGMVCGKHAVFFCSSNAYTPLLCILFFSLIH